mmetsp:Transcript_24749/g.59549  ORF Transcript_24749/g.59549 Transcript_24749/m.59549 type:complete len:202 (-) Transcript_24749:406-1011(-)
MLMSYDPVRSCPGASSENAMLRTPKSCPVKTCSGIFHWPSTNFPCFHFPTCESLGLRASNKRNPPSAQPAAICHMLCGSWSKHNTCPPRTFKARTPAPTSRDPSLFSLDGIRTSHKIMVPSPDPERKECGNALSQLMEWTVSVCPQKRIPSSEFNRSISYIRQSPPYAPLSNWESPIRSSADTSEVWASLQTFDGEDFPRE